MWMNLGEALEIIKHKEAFIAEKIRRNKYNRSTRSFSINICKGISVTDIIIFHYKTETVNINSYLTHKRIRISTCKRGGN